MQLFGKKKVETALEELSRIENEKLIKIEKELNSELKKLPKKQRAKAKKLLKLFEKGYYLRPEQDVDNKEVMKRGSLWANS